MLRHLKGTLPRIIIIRNSYEKAAIYRRGTENPIEKLSIFQKINIPIFEHLYKL